MGTAFSARQVVTRTMKLAAVCVLALLAASAFASFQDAPVIDYDIIEEVNDPASKSSWVAGENERFHHVTIREARKLMGTFVSQSRFEKKVHEDLKDVPAEFDARKQWPNCIIPIQNQEQCGSCWAFGAAESLSDRLCIQSNGNISVLLSPETLVACDKDNYGCSGGYLDNAWNFMKNKGVLSMKCFPYTSGSGSVPSCPTSKCPGAGVYKKYYAKSVYDIPNDAGNIEKEIYENGPVEAAFQVYQDFMHYKSGVYTHKTGNFLGGHAIKIVGWGTEDNTDYWLVANSWGPSWGLDGFQDQARHQRVRYREQRCRRHGRHHLLPPDAHEVSSSQLASLAFCAVCLL